MEYTTVGTRRTPLGSKVSRVLAAAGLAVSATAALGQTDSYWNTAFGGAWTNAARWSSNPDVPNNGGGTNYRAFIEAVGSNYTITSNSDITLDYLRINSANATLRLDGGILSAPVIDLFAGRLELAGGTIANSTLNIGSSGLLAFTALSALDGMTINGNFTTAGTVQVRHGLTLGGTMTFTGSLLFEGDQTLTGDLTFRSNAPSAIVLRRDLDTGIDETLTLAAGSRIHGFSAGPGGSLIIGGTSGDRIGRFVNNGEVTADSPQLPTYLNVDRFTNNGTIKALSGSLLSISGLEGNLNSAVVTGSNSRLVLDGAYTINTPVSVTSGSLTLNGDWTNIAGITATNATINLGGQFTFGEIGPITRSGSTLVNISGTLDNTGQTLVIDSASTALGLNGGTITGGAITTSNGQRLTQRGGNSSLVGVQVNGDTTVTTGTLTADAATSFSGEVALSQGILQYADGAVVSSGLFNFTSSSAGAKLRSAPAAAPSTLILGPAVVVRGAAGQVGEAGLVGAETAVINQGRITADVSGTTLSVSADIFTNSGTIEAINGATLSVRSLQGSTATARVLGGGSHLLLNGAYTIDSPLNVTGGSLTLNGDWTNTAGIVGSNGTINLGGSFTLPEIGPITRGGTTAVNITGELVNSQSIFHIDSASNNYGLTGGTITGGTITTANGQRLVQVSGTSTLNDVSVLGDVTITSGALSATGSTLFSGDVAIGGGALQFPTNTVVPSGNFRFTGSAAGSLRAFPSPTSTSLTLGPGVVVHGGGGRIIQSGSNALYLTNQGLISADVPGQALNVDALLTNTGTVQAINGGELYLNNVQQIGTAHASGAGSVLGLAGYPLVNSGTLSVSDGARMILAGNWTNNGLVDIDHATLDLAGNFPATGLNNIANNGGQVRITGTLDARGQSVTVPSGLNLSVLYNLWSGTLTVPAGEVLPVSGTLAQSVLTGNGTVVLQGGQVREPQATGTPGLLSIGNGITIEGYGVIAGSSTAGFPMTNAGTVRANVAGQTMAFGSNGFVNSGTLEAVNGGRLNIAGSDWANSGTIHAGDASIISLSGSYSFSGGTIGTSGTGTLIVGGSVINTGSTLTATGNIRLNSPTIIGGTVNVPAGNALGFDTASQNAGVRFTGVSLNGLVEVPGSSSSSGRLLYLQNGLTGSSQFHMTGASTLITLENTQTISGADFFFDSAVAGSRRLAAAAQASITLSPTTTVRGGNYSLFDPSVGGTSTTLNNQGLISADVNGQSVMVTPGTMTNSGTIQAINGATLTIGDLGQGVRPWTNTGTLRVGAGSTMQLGGVFTLGDTTIDQEDGGTVRLLGRLNNAGHTLTLNGPTSSFVFANSGWGTIAGGAINVANNALAVPSGGSGVLDGVAVAGGMSISGVLTMLNGTSFTESVLVNAGGRLDAGARNAPLPYTLNSGEVVFNGTTSSFGILGSDNLVLGADMVVRGGNGMFGRALGSSGLWTWANHGKISADAPGKTLVVSGVRNYGTLEAINGGTLSAGGIFESSTVLRAINGTFELNGGPATLITSMERSGADIRLGGVIDNSANTLVMDAATGWAFNTGLRLKGGAVNIEPGANVTLGYGPASGGPILFENLALTGNLVTSPTFSDLTIRNLALTGSITLRTPGSRALFMGDQTFNTGTIVFDPSGGAGERQIRPWGLGAGGSGFAAITFGPDATIRGGDGLIKLGWNAGTLGTFINQGLISADISGTSIGIEQQRFINEGTVQAINGGFISYQGPLSMPLTLDPWLLINSGTLLAGVGSSLYLDDLEATAQSTLAFEIGAAGFGQMQAGNVTFDGLLDVRLVGGYLPAYGSEFLLFDVASQTGSFSAINLPALSGGLLWDTSGLYPSGSLRVVPSPGVMVPLCGLLVLCRRRRP